MVLFTDFGHVTVTLLSLCKTYREKRSKPIPFDKTTRIRFGISHFQWSNSRNQERVSLVNKLASKTQSFISFCNTFFRFYRQNKICMIRIKTHKKVLHNFGNIFKMNTFLIVSPRAIFRTQLKVNGRDFFAKLVNNF